MRDKKKSRIAYVTDLSHKTVNLYIHTEMYEM